MFDAVEGIGRLDLSSCHGSPMQDRCGRLIEAFSLDYVDRIGSVSHLKYLFASAPLELGIPFSRDSHSVASVQNWRRPEGDICSAHRRPELAGPVLGTPADSHWGAAARSMELRGYGLLWRRPAPHIASHGCCSRGNPVADSNIEFYERCIQHVATPGFRSW